MSNDMYGSYSSEEEFLLVEESSTVNENSFTAATKSRGTLPLLELSTSGRHDTM